MICKKFVLSLVVIIVAGIVFLGVPADNSVSFKIPSLLTQEAETCTVTIQIPEWLTLQEAVASPYRRSVRRTARRTARRTSHRHGY